jgi:hypothetical protein
MTRGKPAPRLTQGLIARFFSSCFPSEIKHLHDRDNQMTSAWPVLPSADAAVEFPRRAAAAHGHV